MQAGGEEHDRNALVRIAVVIAPEVDAFRMRRRVPLAIDRKRSRRREIDRVDDRSHHLTLALGGCLRSNYVKGIGRIAADHVGIQLRDDRVDRHGRVIREPLGAEETFLLRRMPDEQCRPARLYWQLRPRLGDMQYAHAS